MAFSLALLTLAVLVGALEYRHRRAGTDPRSWRPRQGTTPRPDRDLHRLHAELDAAPRDEPPLPHALQLLAAAQTAPPMHSAPVTRTPGNCSPTSPTTGTCTA